jgi:hypothetical protein
MIYETMRSIVVENTVRKALGGERGVVTRYGIYPI